MLLYIIRHGHADTPAPTDDMRELTEKGRRVTKEVAELLNRSGMPKPTLIISSPLIRAEQTARIVHQHFAPEAEFELSAALKPSQDVTRPMALLATEKHASILIASHDPLVSMFVSALLTGSERPVVEMEKSAVAIFEITRMDVLRMRGVLRAYIPPSLAAI